MLHLKSTGMTVPRTGHTLKLQSEREVRPGAAVRTACLYNTERSSCRDFWSELPHPLQGAPVGSSALIATQVRPASCPQRSGFCPNNQGSMKARV